MGKISLCEQDTREFSVSNLNDLYILIINSINDEIIDLRQEKEEIGNDYKKMTIDDYDGVYNLWLNTRNRT